MSIVLPALHWALRCCAGGGRRAIHSLVVEIVVIVFLVFVLVVIIIIIDVGIEREDMLVFLALARRGLALLGEVVFKQRFAFHARQIPEGSAGETDGDASGFAEP